MNSKIQQCKTLIENQSKLATQILEGELNAVFEENGKVFVRVESDQMISYDQFVKLTENQMELVFTGTGIRRSIMFQVEIVV